MAIDFNKDSVWSLRPIDASQVNRDVYMLMIKGEEIIAAFKTMRDQLIFTDKRIISVDLQGITGTRKSFASMPYSKVNYFTVQTASIAEFVLADAELELSFANGFTAKFEFSGGVDIAGLARLISGYMLG